MRYIFLLLLQIRAIDEDIICSLSTLDQLMSLCTHHYSCSHFTLADCRDGVEFGKFERLSANLEVMQDCFYIRSLLKNATERELLLLPTLSYQSEDSPSNIRLCILLESLHRELAKVTHVTIEVRNPNFWLEIISGIHESVLRRPNAKDKRVLRTTDDESFCPTRIYVSRLSPWRAVITALLVNPQHVIMATSDVIATIPILVFHCDEPMIAHHLAHKEPRRCETYISDHRTKSPTSTLAHLNRQVRRTGNSTSNFFSKGIIEDVSYEMERNELELHWLSTARIGATDGRVHTSFDLHSYCEAIEDQLFSRALVASVYRSLLEGVHIPYEDLVEVLEDRCEQAFIEIEDINECLHFLCSHVANIRRQTGDSGTDISDENKSSDYFKDDVTFRLREGEEKTCEGEQEDFRFAFSELLSLNFSAPSTSFPTFLRYDFIVLCCEKDHLAISNLTIDLPGTKDFTSNAPCLNLQFCCIDDGEEKAEKDSVESNKSSVSFESVTVSGSSAGETFHLDDNTAVPLFLNLSCTVRFSNTEIFTFPIDHLPFCVMELLKQCSNIANKNLAAMDLIGISFDIYVLSWPVRQVPLEQSDFYAASPETFDCSPRAFHKSTIYFDFDSPNVTETSDVICQLPQLEKEAVRRLQYGISRLLRMETVLVLSRFEDVTLDTLQKVISFTTNEQRERSDPDRIKVKVLQIVMVMEQIKAIRRLKERLKSFHLLYCKLQVHPESNNLFYCCAVTEVDMYRNTLMNQGRATAKITLKSQRSSSSFTDRVEEQVKTTLKRRVSSMQALHTNLSGKKMRRRNSSAPVFKANARYCCDSADISEIAERLDNSDHELRDFWIIVSVEIQRLQVYFCDRYAHHHEKVFDFLLETIQNECRIINQELLLEKMHSTNECDNLLIESEASSHKFSPSDGHDSISDIKLTRSVVHKDITLRTGKDVTSVYSDENNEDDASYVPPKVYYSPGHFACPIVAHHWFYIHPRLRSEMRGPGYCLGTVLPSITFEIMGCDVLRQGIEQFAVRNRRNLYVYCEDTKRKIFYMQLFDSEESFRERCSNYDAKIIDEISEKFQNNVLLTIHGIHQPGTVMQSIVDTMQKRLELRILEDLTMILQKNLHSRLTAADVEFIQRDPAKPFAVHYCTLPNFTHDYLGSLYYYIYQQMLTFTAEARFRDCGGGINKNSSVSTERTHFYSQFSSQSTCSNYVPRFFLINKPPTKGSSNMGIACVEIRIVDSSGACVGLLKNAQISSSTHSQLYPGGGKLRLSSRERFHELTRCVATSLPLPDSLLSENTGTSISCSKIIFHAGAVSNLVQYAIWQVGDVGLSTLKPLFRRALQQALCDLVTEFGLLSVPLLHTPTHFFPSSQIGVSLDPGEPRKRSSSDASYSNFITKSLLKLESHLQLPLSNRQLQQRSLGKLKVKDGLSSGNTKASYTSVNSQFLAIAAQWFDHVVSEIFNAIRDKLSEILSQETIVLSHIESRCKNQLSRQSSLDENVLTFAVRFFKTYFVLHSLFSQKFVLRNRGVSITELDNDFGRIFVAENEEPSLIMLACNPQYSEMILKYGADSASGDIPAAFGKIFQDPKVTINNLLIRVKVFLLFILYSLSKNIFAACSMRFLPQTVPFVPRQHLLYLLSRGETVTLYLYNYSSETAEDVHKVVANILLWQNARSRLLREIGLHKMGITHLSGRITPNSEELVWLNSELLSEYEIPQYGSAYFDQRLVLSGSQCIQVEPFMHLYRHTPFAFLPFNLNKINLFEDQCSQMVILEKEVSFFLMKWMLRDCKLFCRIHEELLNDADKINKSDLLRIISRSRMVHFIHSPLLLFPKWRKLVALSRRGTENAVSFRQAVAGDVFTNRDRDSKMSYMEKRSSLSRIRSTRSKTYNTLMFSSERKSRKLGRSSEEGEPYCSKIQCMLIESYVDYLKTNGLRLLNVTNSDSATRQIGGRYSLHSYMQFLIFLSFYFQSTASSPNFWMYKACDGGILFVYISIVEPHISVQYFVWSVAQLNRLNIKRDKKFDYRNQRDLEILKDNIISLSHVHSFTYDFHLRMVATYLVGGQQVLFSHGYNTNEFLMDFLQYYNCRPPYARNCIYEEKMVFPDLPVTNQKIWEFMLSDKRRWRVVRLKTQGISTAGQFMIVFEEDRDCFGLSYKEIGAIIHENQLVASDTLKLKFYIMLVSHERTSPFIENLEFQTSCLDKKFSGEFKALKGSHEYCANDDDELNLESRNTEQNAWDTSIVHAEGRHCSGENIKSDEEIILPSKRSNDMELEEKKFVADGDVRQLFIQKIAPLRHRKIRLGGDVVLDRPAIVPREQAFYIYFMSARQKKLQDELEDCVVNYKQKLQLIIDDAAWHCLRNELWNEMIEKPTIRREILEMTEQWKLLARHNHDIAVVLRSALSTNLTIRDVDTLLEYVRSESLNMHEPLLNSLVDTLNNGLFFKLIIQHFGSQMCRLFCSSQREERQINEFDSLLMEADSMVRQQFDEIVSCAACFVWMNLVHINALPS
ncbi:unnamed protein product [Thelazia callipaeda]|uniref:Protein SZT2 n=1 Tax=Thelazia callipaeda TaxID=103827 RepID=A0A158RAV7_THECL|nr:unnamed protein product [Thelazia callipaeda]